MSGAARLRLIRAAVPLGVAALLGACVEEPAPEPIGPPPSSGVGFDAIDTNADDHIDHAEWTDHGHRTFDALDGDGSGEVSHDELRDGFDIYDVNGDGVLTKDEVDSVELDLDGDGKVTRAEWEQAISAGPIDTDRNARISRKEYQMYHTANLNRYEANPNGAYSRLALAPDAAGFTLFRF
ncbi:hypothetical protein KHP62_02470 [Rhodobacteraceae bacterium NNCM2]|nr:hypothetical protein [Coraliihabitans acroporae]